MNPERNKDLLIAGIFLMVSGQFLSGFFGGGVLKTTLMLLGIGCLVVHVVQRIALRRSAGAAAGEDER